MADIKWIKITTDIFSDEKIMLLESLPESDTMIVIWFKLLCLAGKQNNNGVFMINDKMPYTDEMLSTIFRTPLPSIRLALHTFEQFGMIEVRDNIISITNWEKHQNIEAMERIRENNRIRQQRYRDRHSTPALEGGSESVTTTENEVGQNQASDGSESGQNQVIDPQNLGLTCDYYDVTRYGGQSQVKDGSKQVKNRSKTGQKKGQKKVSEAQNDDLTCEDTCVTRYSRERDATDKSRVDKIRDKEHMVKIASLFDRVWAEYPRKEKRKESLAAFERAIRGGVDFDDILRGVIAYRDYCADEGIERQYIKQGATYFRGECWNDELVSRKSKTESKFCSVNNDESWGVDF